MMDVENAMALARHILDASKCTYVEAASNPAIPKEYRDEVERRLKEEETTELKPVTAISRENLDLEWLDNRDRSKWYYWPRLRKYLLQEKKWPIDRVRSLDDNSDNILRHLSPPEKEEFDIRGLVRGNVQSGKTANYTSLIAKAADVDYKLFIVLTGMDNGLRRQTQLRLEKELIGGNLPNAIEPPPPGKQWHVFTSNDINGDFQSGHANTASLQGTDPVLMVIKKNSTVLQRVIGWIETAEAKTLRQLPVLVVDDEADQASIDTAGSRMREGEEMPPNYDPPSTINKLIRKLLSQFTRCSFVAYTATPYANVLIPADQSTPECWDDLYPRDFIVDLPTPKGYWGAEKLFGSAGLTGEEGSEEGINVLRSIPEEDAEKSLGPGSEAPQSLRSAIQDYALAGAARTKRNESLEKVPSAMLVHTSRLVAEHSTVREIVQRDLQELRDAWRYEKDGEIKNILQEKWDHDFVPNTNNVNPSDIATFNDLKDYIGPFLESIQVRIINSEEGDIIDYEEEPYANTIAIGGNKLSRGVTLEGLLVSYFTRRSSAPMYDTVMQMGRWFGFRQGYVDLTRLYMTDQLMDMFAHLAIVDQGFGEDMTMYATRKGVTPRDYGMRVLAHPAMQVTSRLKQRFSENYRTSYSGEIFQTFRFPLGEPEALADSADQTLESTKNFLSTLGPVQREEGNFIWRDVSGGAVSDYLDQIKNREHENDLRDVKKYIDKNIKREELVRWTVVISQLQRAKEQLEYVDWGVNEKINQLVRTRLVKKTNNLGVIVEPGDMKIGLSDKQITQAHEKFIAAHESPSRTKFLRSKELRIARPAEEGLLILYPISKYSTPVEKNKGNRVSLYEDPDNEFARNLIGVAISFPESRHADPAIYVHGTPGWNQQL